MNSKAVITHKMNRSSSVQLVDAIMNLELARNSKRTCGHIPWRFMNVKSLTATASCPVWICSIVTCCCTATCSCFSARCLAAGLLANKQGVSSSTCMNMQTLCTIFAMHLVAAIQQCGKEILKSTCVFIPMQRVIGAMYQAVVTSLGAWAT